MTRKKLLLVLSAFLILTIQSCDKCKDVDCLYGTCEDGECDCYNGYYGSRCQFENTPCNYIQWTGSLNCPSGSYPVSNDICCKSDVPYYCATYNTCHETCEGAEAACNGTTTITKANLTGGGGSGGGSSGYVCNNGTCAFVSSGATYSSIAVCQTVCQGTGGTSGYVCSSGTCSFVSSGATYSSLSSCESSCVSSTGQLMIWNSLQQPCPAGAGNTISVYVNGSYVGGISSYYTSTPSCGASGMITRNLSPGSYSVSASCGSTTWPSNSIQVNAGACSRFQLR